MCVYDYVPVFFCCECLFSNVLCQTNGTVLRIMEWTESLSLSLALVLKGEMRETNKLIYKKRWVIAFARSNFAEASSKPSNFNFHTHAAILLFVLSIPVFRQARAHHCAHIPCRILFHTRKHERERLGLGDRHPQEADGRCRALSLQRQPGAPRRHPGGDVKEVYVLRARRCCPLVPRLRLRSTKRQ